MKAITRIPYLLVLLIWGTALSSQDRSNILARVNGVAIRESQLNEKMRTTINSRYFHRKLPPEQEREIKKESLERLIEEELIYQDAKKKHLEISWNDVENQYQSVRRKFESSRAFREALKESGYRSEKEWKRHLERNLLILENIRREVSDPSTITQAEAETFYQSNISKFKKPETVILQSIFIKTHDPLSQAAWQQALSRAEDIITRLDAGADFSDLARKYSDDGYRIKGGHLGEIHRGRLDREVEDAAFSLAVGRLSAPIRTTTGYTIIKVLNRNESRQLTFSEIKERMSVELREKKRAENRVKWIERLKASAKIEMFADFD